MIAQLMAFCYQKMMVMHGVEDACATQLDGEIATSFRPKQVETSSR